MIMGRWAIADRLARFYFQSRFSKGVPKNIAPVILEYPEGVLRLGYQRGHVLSSLAIFFPTGGCDIFPHFWLSLGFQAFRLQACTAYRAASPIA